MLSENIQEMPSFAKAEDHPQYGCVFLLIAFILFSHGIIVICSSSSDSSHQSGLI